jgi:hypothetical protein
MMRTDGEPVLRERLMSAVDRGLVVSAGTGDGSTGLVD